MSYCQEELEDILCEIAKNKNYVNITSDIFDNRASDFFNNIFEAAIKKIEEQYKQKRISGNEYAAVVKDVLISAMQISVQSTSDFFTLKLNERSAEQKELMDYIDSTIKQKELEKQDADIELVTTQTEELISNNEKDRETKDAQINVYEEQAKLYDRQNKSYDDQLATDLYKVTMDGFSVYGTSMAEEAVIMRSFANTTEPEGEKENKLDDMIYTIMNKINQTVETGIIPEPEENTVNVEE